MNYSSVIGAPTSGSGLYTSEKSVSSSMKEGLLAETGSLYVARSGISMMLSARMVPTYWH